MVVALSLEAHKSYNNYFGIRFVHGVTVAIGDETFLQKGLLVVSGCIAGSVSCQWRYFNCPTNMALSESKVPKFYG